MEYAATIGFFDGVHLGHSFLLSQLRQQAEERGMGTLAVTFATHPRELLTGVTVPLLTSGQERVSLLHKQADRVAVLDFAGVRTLTAAGFLSFLRDRYGVRLLLMGYDHRFGSDRLASPAGYAACGRDAGVEVLFVGQAPEGAVSSSQIRAALLRGDVEAAASMLGRPYSFGGTVVHGRGLGHTIGFPTANILPSEPRQLIPENGVYAARLAIHAGDASSDSEWRAVVNVGTNPTVGNTALSVEAHLPDYKGPDLYGTSVTLCFLRRLRNECRFSSLEALRNRIALDILSL